MRFASLGSGSKGNGTLIEHGGTCLLVDCGFTLSETERRLACLNKRPTQLSAVLITHEHGDHVRGAGALARKYALPLWTTPGTWSAHDFGHLPARYFFNNHASFAIGDVQICPFPVPHDAHEPSQFVFSDGARRIGLLTDTGCATVHIETMLTACDALLLECNHDNQMLNDGFYSPPLKRRVGGDLGHLSNAQAAQLLASLDCSRLQHLVAMHLSENNNTPSLARLALSAALGCAPEWIAVADQQQGLTWRDVL